MLQQMETYILELIWGGTINIITNWPCFVSFETVQKLRKDNSELKLVFFFIFSSTVSSVGENEQVLSN